MFQHGREVARQACESTEEASLIVEWWNEQEGTECRVDDLSIHHGPDDILEAPPSRSTTATTARTEPSEVLSSYAGVVRGDKLGGRCLFTPG